MPVDLSRARLPPRSYQVEGVEHIVSHPFCMIGDEMRLGKSKQSIDAAQVLMTMGVINRVIVVCPNSVRSVWFDPDNGQLATHLWEGTRNKVTQYRHQKLQWTTRGDGPWMYWLITNYEFIRNPDRLQELLKIADKKTLLILDESSAVKSHRTLQSDACSRLRFKCGRVVLLNGTPIAHSPGDLYSQADIMHPKILDCCPPRKDGSVRPLSGYYAFRARYAQLGGFQDKQIIAWRNLEDLQQRLKPYVIQRLTKDYFDTPERIYDPLIVPLSEPTWKIYKGMRDDLIAWLSKQTVAVANQAGVKAMRLAQITSGFVGGVECEACDNTGCELCQNQSSTREVGREKLDYLLEWLKSRFEEDPKFKIVVWARFRPEVLRMEMEFKAAFPGVAVARLLGGQKDYERDFTKSLLHPATSPDSGVIVPGTPRTGSMGLDFSAANHEVYASNDRSLLIRKQSEARVAGPMQKKGVWVGDVFATGPQGQKTIDHVIVKALKEQDNLATWTCAAWIKKLKEE